MDKRYIILGLAVTLLIVFGTLWFLSSRKPKSAEINFVTYSEDEKNLEQIIADFESVNPSIKINYTKKDLANYEVDSLNMVATGKIDVWGMPVNWLPKQHNKLAPAAITPEEYQKIYPKTVTQNDTIGNKIYGYPLSLDTLVMFENQQVRSDAFGGRELTKQEQDILSKTPTNWEDLASQSRLITSKQGNNVTRSGLAIGTSSIASATDILTLMMLQYGTQMTNDQHTQATFHTAQNKFGGVDYPGSQALELYTSFSKTDSLNFSFSDTMGDALRAFAQGKVAYYIDYAAKAADIKRINPNVNFTTLPVPQVKETKNPLNILDYEIFTVPSSSKNQTQAWQFLEYITNQANVSKYTASNQKPSALTYSLENADQTIANAVEMATSWYNPDPIEVDKIFKGVINEVVIAGKSPQTSLEGAALKVATLLEQIKE